MPLPPIPLLHQHRAPLRRPPRPPPPHLKPGAAGYPQRSPPELPHSGNQQRSPPVQPQRSPPEQPHSGYPQRSPPVQPQRSPPEQPHSGYPQRSPPVQPHSGYTQRSPPEQPHSGYPQRSPPEQPHSGYPQRSPPEQPHSGYPQRSPPEQPHSGYPQRSPPEQPHSGYPQRSPPEQPHSGLNKSCDSVISRARADVAGSPLRLRRQQNALRSGPLHESMPNIHQPPRQHGLSAQRPADSFSLRLAPEALHVIQRRLYEKQVAQRKCGCQAGRGPGSCGEAAPPRRRAPANPKELVKISLLNDKHRYDDEEYEEDAAWLPAWDEALVRRCTAWVRDVEMATARARAGPMSERLQTVPHLLVPPTPPPAHSLD